MHLLFFRQKMYVGDGVVDIVGDDVGEGVVVDVEVLNTIFF